MRLYKSFKPLVSVVIPTFNRAALLERAVKSALNQTFGNLELIIVDDGSEDGTFEAVQKFLVEHPNIRYVKQANNGLPVSLNVGIKLSAGRFVTFLGSDDEYLPEHIEKRVDFLTGHPEIDLLHGGVKIVGDPYVKDKNNLHKKIHIKDCAVGGTFFGKRIVFTKLGGFKNLSYSEDSEFLERAQKFFNVKKVTFPTYVYYRNSPDSICNNI